jgi:hypothetical protein
MVMEEAGALTWTFLCPQADRKTIVQITKDSRRTGL